jgi:ubiquitin carboxyl-terminal hydrolase 34
VSDEEEKDIDDVVNLTEDKYSAQSLDKMITLVAVLVEKSRVDKHLRLSDKDFQAITAGGKVFV